MSHASGPRPRLPALLLCLALLAACGRAPARTACDPRGDAAVVVSLVDEGGAPVEGATLRVRGEDEPWREFSGPLGSVVTLRGGPGVYRIEAVKEMHAPAGVTVTVPAGADDCHALRQEVTLALVAIPCLAAPEPLALELLAPDPAPDLLVMGEPPSGLTQPLACVGPEPCRRFTLPLGDAGTYRLLLSGLPGPAAMDVVDGVAHYAHEPFALALSHAGHEETIRGRGALSLSLAVPVRQDEVGCPLVDFTGLEVLPEPDLSDAAPYPPAALHYAGSLTMTGPGADACRAAPSLTALPLTIDLPEGARLGDVRAFAVMGERVEPATCALRDGAYRCEVLVPNPLVDTPFALRAIVAGEEVISIQVPFAGLCLIFSD